MGFAATCERVVTSGFDGASAVERDGAVRELVLGASVAGAAACVQPIPLLDTVLLLPLHATLVQAIARVHGYELDKKAVVEILGTFGVSIVARHAIRSAVRFIPGLGLIVGASMGYAMTYAIGEVADHYFRSGRGIPSSELRTLFEETYRTKRAEKERAHADDRSLKRKLEQLREAFDAGFLSGDEYAKMKEELLAGF